MNLYYYYDLLSRIYVNLQSKFNTVDGKPPRYSNVVNKSTPVPYKKADGTTGGTTVKRPKPGMEDIESQFINYLKQHNISDIKITTTKTQNPEKYNKAFAEYKNKYHQSENNTENKQPPVKEPDDSDKEYGNYLSSQGATDKAIETLYTHYPNGWEKQKNQYLQAKQNKDNLNEKPITPTVTKKPSRLKEINSIFDRVTEIKSNIKESVEQLVNMIPRNMAEFESVISSVASMSADIKLIPHDYEPYLITYPEKGAPITSLIAGSHYQYVSDALKPHKDLKTDREYKDAIKEMKESGMYDKDTIFQNPHQTPRSPEYKERSKKGIINWTNFGYRPEENEGIHRYKQEDYDEVNICARFNVCIDDTDESVQMLDNALNRSVTAIETTVMRGLGGRRADSILAMQPGDVYYDGGFNSFSHDAEKAQRFSEGVGIIVTVPAGTNAIEFGDVDWENELLLGRKYGYKVIGHQVESAITYVKVELVELSEKERMQALELSKNRLENYIESDEFKFRHEISNGIAEKITSGMNGYMGYDLYNNTHVDNEEIQNGLQSLFKSGEALKIRKSQT
jgi:hypothetical protein